MTQQNSGHRLAIAAMFACACAAASDARNWVTRRILSGFAMLVALAVVPPVCAQPGTTVQQPLVAFELVDQPALGELGLVMVQSNSGGCSGAMPNDYWVLTAHHCLIGATAATTTVTPADNPSSLRSVIKIVDLVSMGQLDLALLHVSPSIPHLSPVSLPEITPRSMPN